MAGEWIIKQMNKRGGHANEFADLEFGTVLSANPLKVQLSAQLILTEPFLIVGRNVTNHVETMTIDGTKKKITVNNALEDGDKIVMFRMDGGQKFYILEKL